MEKQQLEFHLEAQRQPTLLREQQCYMLLTKNSAWQTGCYTPSASKRSQSVAPSRACDSNLMWHRQERVEQGSHPKQSVLPTNGRWKCALVAMAATWASSKTPTLWTQFTNQGYVILASSFACLPQSNSTTMVFFSLSHQPTTKTRIQMLLGPSFPCNSGMSHIGDKQLGIAHCIHCNPWF